jgi:ABC-type branched-subunit amino acid transport system ATPase component
VERLSVERPAGAVALPADEPTPATDGAGVPRAGHELLQVRDVHLRFGGVKALQGVSFDVHRGELFAVIGPNGAGKTSIFNCLNAVYRPQEGSIALEGEDLTRAGRPTSRRSASRARSRTSGCSRTSRSSTTSCSAATT